MEGKILGEEEKSNFLMLFQSKCSQGHGKFQIIGVTIQHQAFVCPEGASDL